MLKSSPLHAAALAAASRSAQVPLPLSQAKEITRTSVEVTDDHSTNSQPRVSITAGNLPRRLVGAPHHCGARRNLTVLIDVSQQEKTNSREIIIIYPPGPRGSRGRATLGGAGRFCGSAAGAIPSPARPPG